MTGPSHNPSAAAPRSAGEQQLLEKTLIDMFEQRITFNTVLGLKLLSVKAGDVRGRIVMRPELVGNYNHGQLHGGVISATLDALGGLALMVGIGERHPTETAVQVMHRFSKMGTIDMRVDYLRPGLGKHFIASAEVMRLGGRLGSTQMRLVNDEGTLIATGAAAYVVT